MAAPSHVFTIRRVAEMLGENADRLQDLADGMDPEEGCLTVVGTDGLSTMAFTTSGIENLRELIADTRPKSASSAQIR